MMNIIRVVFTRLSVHREGNMTEPIKTHDDFSQTRETLKLISCDIHHHKQILREFYLELAFVLLLIGIGFALVISFDISIDSKVILIKLLMFCGIARLIEVIVRFAKLLLKER